MALIACVLDHSPVSSVFLSVPRGLTRWIRCCPAERTWGSDPTACLHFQGQCFPPWVPPGMAILADLLMELDSVSHLSFLAHGPSSAALSCAVSLSVLQQMSLLCALSAVKLKNSRHLEYSFKKKKLLLVTWEFSYCLPPTLVLACISKIFLIH